MRQSVHIGLDYSDFGLRTAVLADGAAHPLPALPPRPDEFILLDGAAADSTLGVAFPTVFRSIGTGQLFQFQRQTITADALVTELLRHLKRVIDRSFTSLGKFVIAVPTTFTSSRRGGLVASAEAAGFKDIDLVDAFIPASLAYQGGSDKASTQLIFFLDYGECEFALVRVVRGRIKVIDSSIVSDVSGQAFDRQVMEAIILALRERNVFLGLKAFHPSQWLLFRRVVGRAREELTRKATVELTMPANLVVNAQPMRLTLSAAGLAAQMAGPLDDTIAEVQGLLERNDVKPTDLDAVVVVGQVATQFPVVDMLARAFAGKILIADARAVSVASACYSAWLDRDQSDTAPLGANLAKFLSPYARSDLAPLLEAQGGPSGPLVSDVKLEDARDSRPVTETVRVSAAPAPVGTPVASTPLNGSASGAAAEAAKALIEEGRYMEAANLLQQMSPDAAGAPPPAADTSAAKVLMREAKDMLSRGLHLNAVALSHRAYDESGVDGEMFAEMLEVHTSAGLALSSPEEYAEAIQLLMCAHAHDQTDRAIHRALVARHLAHAKAMVERGDPAAALEALDKTQTFDPNNADVAALRKQISGSN
jgi:tetratricopeptide (TPR) repeat protein